MSEIIDIAPNGEQIYYDPTGRAMMNVNGQLVYTPQYDRVAQQPIQQSYAPAVQQAYAPAAQQPQQAGGMLAFFTGGVGTETSNLPSYMLGADHTSMDGQDSTMVDTIRLDKRGDFIVNMSGVALPGQRTLDVVILGCGPTGGRSTVYRTFFEGVYNENADAEQKKPVCWSYDNVAPAPNAPARQHVTCQGCPMDVKGSGPNNTRRCGKSQYLMVALASDLTKAYRLKISSKGIYATEVAKNEYGLKPYATLLKSKQANWEGMVTTMHCPDGLSGGIRFLPNRFLTEQEYKQAQELKMNLDVSLYINLDADQDNVTVKLGETVVGQVPTEQLGNVVQHVQQAVTQAVAQVQTQAQPVVQQAAPVAQPVAQPVTQSVSAPVTAPASFKDGLRAHPAFATLPQNVVDYVMHPGVDDATAQQYLAQYFPQVLAPVQPVAAPVAPVSPVVTAPVQPTVTQAAAVQPSPAVSAPVAQPQQPAVAQTPTAHAPVQHAQPVAQASAPADVVMPAQPAEPTMPTEPAAAPQPAQTTTNAVGVQQAQNVNELLAMI